MGPFFTLPSSGKLPPPVARIKPISRETATSHVQWPKSTRISLFLAGAQNKISSRTNVLLTPTPPLTTIITVSKRTKRMRNLLVTMSQLPKMDESSPARIIEKPREATAIKIAPKIGPWMNRQASLKKKLPPISSTLTRRNLWNTRNLQVMDASSLSSSTRSLVSTKTLRKITQVQFLPYFWRKIHSPRKG